MCDVAKCYIKNKIAFKAFNFIELLVKVLVVVLNEYKKFQLMFYYEIE